MNLLKKISISGEVYPCYAKMLYRFDFESVSESGKSPRYIFSIPSDACITEFQILTEDKILHRANTAALTEANEWCGYRLAELQKGFYCFEWEAMKGEVCTLLVECIARIMPENGSYRISLPVGIQSGDYETGKCRVEIELTLNGIYPESLRENENFNTEDKTFTFAGEMNGDFHLICRAEKEENYMIAEEELGAGMAFCRLYVRNAEKDYEYKSAQLFLNLHGLVSEEDIRITKELFFRVFSAFPKDMPIKIYTTCGKYVLDDTYFSNENDRQRIFDILKEVVISEIDPKDILSELYSSSTDETLSVMIANSSAKIEKRDDFPIKLFTVGEYKNNLSGYMNDNIHFYPKDMQEKYIENAVAHMLTDGGYEIDVGTASVREQLVFADTPNGYIDFIISYTGRSPKEITLLKRGEFAGRYLLPKGSAISRQPVAGQLYAMAKSYELGRLLDKASIPSVRAIKKQIAEIGTKYHILNQETMLTIENGGEERRIDFQPCLAFDWQEKGRIDRRTIFGEEKIKPGDDELAKIKELCIKNLVRHIRADGGIYPSCCGLKERAERTAMATLALLVSGERMVVPVADDAKEYLKGKEDNLWAEAIASVRSGNGVPLHILNIGGTVDKILSEWEISPKDFNLSVMLLIKVCS